MHYRRQVRTTDARKAGQNQYRKSRHPELILSHYYTQVLFFCQFKTKLLNFNNCCALMESNLKEYVLNCSNTQISATTQNLMKQISRDLFYPISLWPTRMRQSFWAKPIGDEDTFKLLLFLVENGCSPWLAKDWILTSTFWDKTKTIYKEVISN